MANLIITVISIALVAVAAIMAAYYGGTSFMSGNAKSQANTLINATEQIAAAWQVYTTDHGGDHSISTSIDALNVAFVPNYLASPIELQTITTTNNGRPRAIKLTPSGSTNYVTDSNALQFDNLLSADVCAQINNIITGSPTITFSPSDAVKYDKAAAGYCYGFAAGPTNYYYFTRRFFP